MGRLRSNFSAADSNQLEPKLEPGRSVATGAFKLFLPVSVALAVLLTGGASFAFWSNTGSSNTSTMVSDSVATPAMPISVTNFDATGSNSLTQVTITWKASALAQWNSSNAQGAPTATSTAAQSAQSSESLGSTTPYVRKYIIQRFKISDEFTTLAVTSITNPGTQLNSSSTLTTVTSPVGVACGGATGYATTDTTQYGVGGTAAIPANLTCQDEPGTGVFYYRIVASYSATAATASWLSSVSPSSSAGVYYTSKLVYVHNEALQDILATAVSAQPSYLLDTTKPTTDTTTGIMSPPSLIAFGYYEVTPRLTYSQNTGVPSATNRNLATFWINGSVGATAGTSPSYYLSYLDGFLVQRGASDGQPTSAQGLAGTDKSAVPTTYSDRGYMNITPVYSLTEDGAATTNALLYGTVQDKVYTPGSNSGRSSLDFASSRTSRIPDFWVSLTGKDAAGFTNIVGAASGTAAQPLKVHVKSDSSAPVGLVKFTSGMASTTTTLSMNAVTDYGYSTGTRAATTESGASERVVYYRSVTMGITGACESTSFPAWTAVTGQTITDATTLAAASSAPFTLTGCTDFMVTLKDNVNHLSALMAGNTTTTTVGLAAPPKSGVTQSTTIAAVSGLASNANGPVLLNDNVTGGCIYVSNAAGYRGSLYYSSTCNTAGTNGTKVSSTATATNASSWSMKNGYLSASTGSTFTLGTAYAVGNMALSNGILYSTDMGAWGNTPQQVWP